MTHERFGSFDFTLDFKIQSASVLLQNWNAHTRFLAIGIFLRDKIFPLFILTDFYLTRGLQPFTFKTILLIKRAEKPRDGNIDFCLYLKAVP